MPGDTTIRGLRVALVHPRLGLPDEHRHAFHELVLVEQGVYRVAVAGRQRQLAPGQAIFYPAACEHHNALERDLGTRLWVMQWTGWTPGWDCPFVCPDPGRRVLFALNWMRDRIGAPGGEAMHRALAEALLREIEALRQIGHGDDGPVARVRQMLDHGPEHPWTLAELARHAGLSPSHLCRSFARACGEPPLAWLARRRVEQAEVLCRDGRRPLDEIARSVGYANADTLRRAMRRLGRGPGRRRGG